MLAPATDFVIDLQHSTGTQPEHLVPPRHGSVSEAFQEVV